MRTTHRILAATFATALLGAASCTTPAPAPECPKTDSPTSAQPAPLFGPAVPGPNLWEIPKRVFYSNNGPQPASVEQGIPLYQPYLDQFSWRGFVALNWPALPDGGPDPSKWIGAGGDAPAVWEDWMDADDVFLAGGQEPYPWGFTRPVPPSCKKVPAGKKRVFHYDDGSDSAHDTTWSKRAGDGSTSLGTSSLENRRSGPVIDQNRRWARYEVYLNRVAYEYIVKNKLYSAAGQQAFAESGQKIQFPLDAIEVKVAWKILDPKTDSTSDYHVATALFVDQRGDCEVATLGLAAMHAVYRPAFVPTRIWSTFENQKLHCRMEYDEQTKGYAMVSGGFCSAECMKTPTTPGCIPNKPPPKFTWDKPPPPTMPGPEAPTQVVREDPIPVGAGQVTSSWVSLFQSVDRKSVWKNYELISTQWIMPLDSDLNTSGYRMWLTHPNSGAPAPQYTPRLPGEAKCNEGVTGFSVDCAGLVVPPILANTMIETYSQKASSCFGCHQTAETTAGQDADFAWVLARAK